MYKEVFLTQVDETIDGKTNEQFLALSHEMMLGLAKIEIHRCELTGEICPLTVSLRLNCCRLQAACIAVNLKRLTLLEIEDD